MKRTSQNVVHHRDVCPKPGIVRSCAAFLHWCGSKARRLETVFCLMVLTLIGGLILEPAMVRAEDGFLPGTFETREPRQRKEHVESLPRTVSGPRGDVDHAIFFQSQTNTETTKGSDVRNEPKRTDGSIPLGRRAGSDGQEGAGNSRSNGPSFSSMLLVLGFVVVVILGVARLFMKRSPFAVPGLPKEAVEVLGRRVVEPRSSVFVMKVGTRILLVGSSPAGMTSLSEIDDPIEVATLISYCRGAEQAAAERSLAETVRNWFWRRPQPQTPPRTFSEQFGQRLMDDAQRGQPGTVTSLQAQPRRENQHV